MCLVSSVGLSRSVIQTVTLSVGFNVKLNSYRSDTITPLHATNPSLCPVFSSSVYTAGYYRKSLG